MQRYRERNVATCASNMRVLQSSPCENSMGAPLPPMSSTQSRTPFTVTCLPLLLTSHARTHDHGDDNDEQ